MSVGEQGGPLDDAASAAGVQKLSRVQERESPLLLYQQMARQNDVHDDETRGRVDETTEIMSGGARAEKAGSHKAGRSV